MRKFNLEGMRRLAMLCDLGGHLERISYFCRILTQELQQGPYKEEIDTQFIEDLCFLAPLHDIGKKEIPDNILLKPTSLTEEEFETVKEHTVIGAELIASLGFTNPEMTIADAVTKSHHERWDGNGYPDGLEGEEIPLAARIMALVDVYTALRSQRPYKPPFNHEKACSLIKEGDGQFDPAIVQAFIAQQRAFRAFSSKGDK